MSRDIATELAEVQQSRSEFQLRHFVIGQHPTPEMQYRQCVIELADMRYKLGNATLHRRRMELEIARLDATGDELDAIDADIKRLGLEQQRLAEVGALREVEILRRILDEYPAYTQAEIEANQPDYWRARISREMELQQLGAATGTNWAHIQTLEQIDGPLTLARVAPHEQIGEAGQACTEHAPPDPFVLAH